MSALVGIALMIAIAVFNTPAEPPPPDRVVLLPGEDGKVGRVVVKAAGGEQTLDTAYAGALVVDGRVDARAENPAEVEQRYGAVLAARPLRPVAYTVHFVSGRGELTPESAPVVDELKNELARRPAPEITVIGHTDRVGKVEANDALSVKRAETVRGLLIGQGVPAGSIESAGRGEREPLVPTADEVAEPRNRRVEISVR